ncbi:hypothetical protein PVAND_009529 [Polypedilum vanderplanki]|uniref:Anoctamin n=1 Tax=Polypedilum vanderplanki TaxID=319348 RepID=A0A9J6CD17_POLVA|nr:hypothetical protein PVAND_009529 [Polypedilum vanderplanki]
MDERANIGDWYFHERNQHLNNNHGEEEEEATNIKSTKSKTKDFLSNEINELHAMSKLSLYEGDDKVKLDDKAAEEDSPAEQSLRSSIRFDDEGNDIESIAKDEPDVRMNVVHQPMNESQYPKNPFGDREGDVNSTLYFDDGERSVDYVLVWKKLFPNNGDDEKEKDDIKRREASRAERREVFEENLLNEGLELERYVLDDEITFIKIHAPLEVLRRYAEILKLRMPMKLIPGMTTFKSRTKSYYRTTLDFFMKKFVLDEKHFPPMSHRFTAIYARDKEYLFDLEQPNFFNTWVRARIVQFILDRQRFSRNNAHDFSFGIDRLISIDETYIAAYALHDGEIENKESRRHLLYSKWASLKKIFHHQPLDYIKDYFGVKIGIYFAWLGFYTYMLILASIAGIISFFFSIKWMKSNPITQQICMSNKTEPYMMCPLCDKLCDYWDLKETCLQAEITSLLDNPNTVFFAIFMSFWAALFLENWKRYSAEITHRWDLTGFDVHEEHPRPQYLARLKSIKREKKDFVTNVVEPNVPFWRMKLPATLLSVSVVLLLIAVAFATVLGVVLYRMSMLASLSIYSDFSTSVTILFTTTTAAVINLFLIVILNYGYESLAEWLTELELLRTQTEFDDSLTLKIYLLQFVNYYASIFYIAFFKGKIIGTPKAYNRFFDFRQEECGLGGCLMELFIQLAIIMIGKQTMNCCVEMLWPVLMKYYNSLRLRTKKRDGSKEENRRYVNDLKLIEFGSRGLFPEYLEMVLQYGFITIFVTAFPLAPFFALLNNIFEMRFDAKKLLLHYRRPIFARVRSIGIWYRILDCISKLSVITNAFIIAFTSDFIPRLVYMFYYSNDGTLNGYVDWTLARFDTSEFKNGTAPLPSVTQYTNITECRYQDFRYPPNHPNEYERTGVFWNVFAARLIFVVLFENAVAVVMLLVRWLIPDISAELRDQIRREAYITNEIIIKQEALRASEVVSARSYIKSQNAWNKLLANNLSGSQLDLFIHNQQEERTRNRCKRNNRTGDFLHNETIQNNIEIGDNNLSRKGEETNV